jgi:hypothetical protein
MEDCLFVTTNCIALASLDLALPFVPKVLLDDEIDPDGLSGIGIA